MSSDYERMCLKLYEGWHLSPRLFDYDVGSDIHDFEMSSYVYFLDHVRSKEDLLQGLHELSPLADDALAVAERMSDQNFIDFKLALIREKQITSGGLTLESCMPKRFDHLVLPKRFLKVLLSGIPEKFEVCLGVALVRCVELEEST